MKAMRSMSGTVPLSGAADSTLEAFRAEQPSANGSSPALGDFKFPPRRVSLLTAAEVARELRCSKAHVHNLINGRVRGARPLPSLWLGRRRLICRASLEEWIRANEHTAKECYDPIEPGFIAKGAREE